MVVNSITENRDQPYIKANEISYSSNKKFEIIRSKDKIHIPTYDRVSWDVFFSEAFDKDLFRNWIVKHDRKPVYQYRTQISKNW